MLMPLHEVITLANVLAIGQLVNACPHRAVLTAAIL